MVLQLGGELREPFAGLRRVRIGAAGVEECAQQVVAVGFQRVADLIWNAADSQARGFLFGATAGRWKIRL